MLEHTSLPNAVRTHAARGCSSALRFGRSSAPISYADLWQCIEEKARFLAAAGFEPGQRVALAMSNTLETVSTVLAVMHVGGTVIPMFYRQGMRASGKDHARIVATLRVSRAPLAFTHAAELEVLQDAAQAAGGHARVFAYEQEVPAGVAALEGVFREDIPALIQFSAGSTSEPKGLCLGHSQLVTNVAAIGVRLEMSERDLWCSWLPLFHDMGLVGSLFSTLYWGAGFSMFSPAEFVRNPLAWIEQVSIDRATITVAPQFAYTMCVQKVSLSQLPPDAFELSELRLVLNGAEAVDVAVCDEFERCFAPFGLREHAVQPCYGLAENCVAVSVRAPGTPRVAHHFDRVALSHGRTELRAKPSANSVTRAGNGFAIDGTRVAVLDAGDAVQADGCVGEIAIAGDATARAILVSDGSIQPLPEWVRTGDLGLMLEGELYVVGRVKEVVKRGGEQFAPTDIEACASAEARVAGQRVQVTGVAAFGFRDEVNGCEEVVVVAETRDYRHEQRALQLAQQLRKAVLREFRLPLYDVIIARPGTIPRTTSGKTQRLALRDRYLQGELAVSAE